MALRTKTELESQIATLLADNSAGAISEGDVRSVLQDIADSFAFLTNIRTNAQITAIATAAALARYTATEKTKLSLVESGLTTTQINTLIQTALAAAVTSNTETGIIVTYNTDGTIDFVVSGGGGGGGGSIVTDDIYFGLSTDDTPQGSELTIAGVAGVGTIPAFNNRYMLIARLATEDDILSVTFSDDQSGLNQVAAFAKYSSTVVPTVESEAFNVWVSNQLLTQAAAADVTVS